MKKLVSLLLAIMLLTASARAIDLYVDNDLINTDTPPTIVDGRTLVPVRAIFEAIGATVTWDADTRTATGVRGDVVVSIQIDNTTAYVNGQPQPLDVPAKIINGRTMVPARFISEAMGCDVSWYQATQTVGVAYQLKGINLYATPAGEKYHYDGSCNGGTYYQTTLAEITGRKLTPCDKCVLTNAEQDTDPAQPANSVVPDQTPDNAPISTPGTPSGNLKPGPTDTVYVSKRSNTIHSVHDCGGMKNYREMTRAEADAKGYKYCPNCW